MSKAVEHEIGPDYEEGGLVLLGRDPGYNEVREGRPFVGKAGRLLDDCLVERGIARRNLAILNISRFQPPGNNFAAHDRHQLANEQQRTLATLLDLKPSLIVALGNEAAHTLIDNWPGETVFDATGIMDRRGFVFDSVLDIPVLATVHPAFAGRSWKPWRTLLSSDLEKAKALLAQIQADGHLRRPQREIIVVTGDDDVGSAVQTIFRAGRAACDIEIYDERRLACVGFATSSRKAFVFPAQQIDRVRELLESPRMKLTFQNGIFDTHFLRYREGIEVKGFTDDTMLAWHSIAPELAGAQDLSSGGRKRNKATRKSLAFLASLFTVDEYWKDYDFADDHEMYVLNGKDCCITWDIMENHLRPMMQEYGVTDFPYTHEIGLTQPCVDMLARGMNVDEALRRERIEALEASVSDDKARINELVLPLLEERWERLSERERGLFEHVEGVCECCRHGESKQQACWSCEGFDSAPSKTELVEHYGEHEMLKAEMEEEFLPVCRVCGGELRREWRAFNSASVDQKRVILYKILRLPERYSDGSLSTNEDTLKSLVGTIS